MDKLKLSVASVPEAGIVVEAVVTAAEICPKGVEAPQTGPVTVSGALTAVGDEYMFKGGISGRFLHACDRCLEQVEAPFHIDVLWAFERGVAPILGEALDVELAAGDESAEESGATLFEGNEIDLAPRIWEEILLDAPTKFLCKEDCAGLCSSCGANLNRGPCACLGEVEQSRPMNEGLSVLRDLFPTLPADHLED